MKTKEWLSEAELEARRDTWNHIRRVTSSDLSDRAKLEFCLNAGLVYAALTGDCSLVPPQVNEAHDKIIAEIPRVLADAKSKQLERMTGRQELM